MREIKDRQGAASDIDPIVANLADDVSAAAVEGFGDGAEADEASVRRLADGAGGDESDDASSARLDPVTVAAAIEVALGIEAMPGDAGAAPYRDMSLASEAMPADLAAAEAALTDALATAVEPPPATIPTPFERMTATYADTVVELEAPDDDDGRLLDDELEHGIASVFAALHAAAQGEAEPVEPLGEVEAADGVTFRLLGELDRIWHRAA